MCTWEGSAEKSSIGEKAKELLTASRGRATPFTSWYAKESAQKNANHVPK